MTAATRKLALINLALSNTSNNLATAEDLTLPDHDPDAEAGTTASYEWDRASKAYDRELPILLERHPWPFAKATEALDQVVEDENPSNRFGYAYDWPYDALWLQKVEAPGGLAIDYEIIGRYICADYDGTDTDAPIATFVQNPDSSTLSNLFKEILTLKVEVGCLRSINEDLSEAKARDVQAEAMLSIVRTRTDQQRPARRAFRSTILERRRGGGGPRVYVDG